MLNRRHLFGASAAAVAMAALPIAAVAASSDLAALASRWENLCAQETRLWPHLDQTYDRYLAGLPKPPKLKFTAADAARSTHPQKGKQWDWKAVEQIAKDAETWRTTEPDRYPARQKWAVRFERAVERHEAQIQAWDNDCGYSAASDAWDALQAEIATVERQIIAVPCRSTADAQIKARVALKNVDNDHGSEAAFAVAAFILKEGLN